MKPQQAASVNWAVSVPTAEAQRRGGNAKESEVKKNESGVKNRGAASPLTIVLAFHIESLLPSFASPLRLRASAVRS
jgi:hypothetical protein